MLNELCSQTPDCYIAYNYVAANITLDRISGSVYTCSYVQNTESEGPTRPKRLCPLNQHGAQLEMCQEEVSEIMKLQLASYSLLLDEYSTEYS